MKVNSLEKLALLKEQSCEDTIKNIALWQEAKGIKISKRDKEALAAGFAAGWTEAIKMIQLHALK